jgi:hypothetical protein
VLAGIDVVQGLGVRLELLPYGERVVIIQVNWIG